MPLFQPQSQAQRLPAMTVPNYRQQLVIAPAPMPVNKPQLQQQHISARLTTRPKPNCWTSQRQYCNLVVLVCGTQFNRHKHPMLFESNKMHRMARDAVETNVDNNANHSSIVPVLELSAFPEGAEMFEILAIYCYTGDVSFSLANVAAMHCAIKFLEMRWSNLLQVVNAAQTLAQVQPELFHASCTVLIETCMHLLVERGETLNADAMLQFFTLPSELFSDFTQRVLASKPLTSPSVRNEIATALCEQAKLAKLHQDVHESLRPSHYSRQIAQQCVKLLQDKSVEAVDAVEIEKMKRCEEEHPIAQQKKHKTMLIEIMDDDLSACMVFPSSRYIHLLF
ncbi:unnamed protein product [Peronospora belbahrii]|uniref:BTB domain-containing protein n=1 Tax=Peronospora belbahrii TaxID=622444 RepID=A0ABN8D2X9_9STRA|nr:unnamed protein product [Peronospora belbahrii]